MKIIGIYTITNSADNKIYVGYSKDCEKRFREHTSLLVNNKHKNIHLQNAWNKHGIESFKFEILEECNKEFLASQEHYYVNMLNTSNPKYGYNILPTHPLKLNSGHSAESKEKMRIAFFSRKDFKEQLENLRKSHIGIKASQETLEKMSKSRRKYKYQIVDKKGNIFTSTSLCNFCKEQGIDKRNMSITFKKDIFRYGFKILSKELF